MGIELREATWYFQSCPVHSALAGGTEHSEQDMWSFPELRTNGLNRGAGFPWPCRHGQAETTGYAPAGWAWTQWRWDWVDFPQWGHGGFLHLLSGFSRRSALEPLTAPLARVPVFKAWITAKHNVLHFKLYLQTLSEHFCFLIEKDKSTTSHVADFCCHSISWCPLGLG